MRKGDLNQYMRYHKYVLIKLIYSHMSLLLAPLILCANNKLYSWF